ncbi:hypothetical protein PML95_07605 [Vagococcus lutrae]|uniref:HipA-like kinase domain-containing protein n=1 Tax=Vagococcus lutrae TaxID=81947 RepID=A0AAE9XMZ2_9ENTE|nr:HipA family kinase [Vagococcus lutrae]UQF23590.1 hypothetical protein M2909_00805 [Vagococcus lutrae]UQF38928.1 hypothetical protein M2904_02840 [Vagococcus lutrae]UQF64324.1 hypothetical protein M2908_00820 [Vagococcus lutrae]WCG22259.1 hypothetical protein PML95_07605 [Vagococcus lutrae]
MKELYVDTFIKDQSPMLGQSKPLLVQASDGNEYFIKNNMVRLSDGRWIDENAAFFHEVVSHNVAKYLGITTPEIAILEIETDVMTANSDLLFGRRFKNKKYFGSKKIYQAEQNLMENFLDLQRLGKPYITRTWNTFFKNISNKNEIASIIAMDLLLGNFDRFNNIGNLVIGSLNNERTIFALDHGHCFKGPSYNAHKEHFLRSNYNLTAESKKNYIDSHIRNIVTVAQYNGTNHVNPFNLAGEVFKAIEQHVDLSDNTDHSFIEPVYKIERLNQQSILNFFSGVPSEWIAGGQTQIKSYSNFMYRQSRLLRDIIQRMATLGAFSNYRGGLLNWKKEELIGIQ